MQNKKAALEGEAITAIFAILISAIFLFLAAKATSVASSNFQTDYTQGPNLSSHFPSTFVHEKKWGKIFLIHQEILQNLIFHPYALIAKAKCKNLQKQFQKENIIVKDLLFFGENAEQTLIRARTEYLSWTEQTDSQGKTIHEYQPSKGNIYPSPDSLLEIKYNQETLPSLNEAIEKLHEANVKVSLLLQLPSVTST